MLKKDDWILTLGEAKSQRNQAQIALKVSEAIIVLAQHEIAQFPDEKKTKADRKNY